MFSPRCWQSVGHTISYSDLQATIAGISTPGYTYASFEQDKVITADNNQTVTVYFDRRDDIKLTLSLTTGVASISAVAGGTAGSVVQLSTTSENMFVYNVRFGSEVTISYTLGEGYQFKEFETYKEYCKYKDCMHDKEDHCMVKDKVEDGTILKSRYENYIQFIRGDV